MVEAGLDAVEFGRDHPVSVGPVAEGHHVPHRRHAVGLVQVDGLDGLDVRPSVEPPRRDDAGRRLDLEVGAAKRALRAVVGHEDEAVAPSDAKVDRAHRYLFAARGEPLANVPRFRDRFEDESDRGFEVSRDEDLEIAR